MLQYNLYEGTIFIFILAPEAGIQAEGVADELLRGRLNSKP